MINHLLSLTKKVLTQSVWKLLLIKTSLLWEELKEEIWKELSWLAVDLLSTLLKNFLKMIWAMLIKSMKLLWVNKNTPSLKELKTQDHVLFWSKVQMSTLLLWLKTLLETDLELSKTFMMIKLLFREQDLSKLHAINTYWNTENLL